MSDGKKIIVSGHITAVIPNRFQASWDEEAVTVCASVVIERESRVGDRMVGRVCNILRLLPKLFDGVRIEKGCTRGRMNASATLRRREDDRPRRIIANERETRSVKIRRTIITQSCRRLRHRHANIKSQSIFDSRPQ